MMLLLQVTPPTIFLCSYVTRNSLKFSLNFSTTWGGCYMLGVKILRGKYGAIKMLKKPVHSQNDESL